MSWLIHQNATPADWRAYERHDVAHHQEMVDLLQAAGLYTFGANIHSDVAAGLGASIGAARKTGAARPTARVVAHDHAPSAEPEIRARFGAITFCDTHGLADVAPVAEGDRVLITASHCLNQCVDANGQGKLMTDIEQISKALARIIEDAREVVFVALEPGWRSDFYTPPIRWFYKWCENNFAAVCRNFRIENRTNPAGIAKAGLVLRLAPLDRLRDFDEGILAPRTQEMSLGFGTVHHPRIEVEVYQWSDGKSMGERRTLIDERGVEAVLEARIERRDRFLASERGNLEIIGLAS